MRLSLFSFFAFLAFPTYGYLEDKHADTDVDQTGNVAESLDYNNFYLNLYGKRTEFGLVLFHRTDSSSSKPYIEKYEIAAWLSSSWTGILKHYEVDCSEEDNRQLCKKYGFKKMPLVKYFKPQTGSDDTGEIIPSYVAGTKMLEEVVKRINRDYPHIQCTSCPNLNFLPNSVVNLNDLWNMHENYCAEQIHAAIVSNENDPMGISTLVKENKKQQGKVWRVLREHPLIRQQVPNDLSRKALTYAHWTMNPEDVKACREKNGKVDVDDHPETLQNRLLTEKEIMEILTGEKESAKQFIGEKKKQMHDDNKDVVEWRIIIN